MCFDEGVRHQTLFLSEAASALRPTSGTRPADVVNNAKNLGSENVRYTDVVKTRGTTASAHRLNQKASVRTRGSLYKMLEAFFVFTLFARDGNVERDFHTKLSVAQATPLR